MPEWKHEIARRLEPLGLPPLRAYEITEELAQHLEDRYQDLLAQGLSDDEAVAGAWREIEASDRFRREVARLERPAPLDLPPFGAPSRGRWLAGVAQDLRYAVRGFRTAPTFSLTVIFALALSIGPATAIISIGNWLLWRPHPGVADSHRVATIWTAEWQSEDSLSPRWLTYPEIAELASRAPSAASIAGGQELGASFAAPGAIPSLTATAHVTANFFETLGVRMRAGRGFSGEDDGGAPAPVAVLGEALARRTFGLPEAALGKTILLNSRAYRVVGVAADAFRGITPTRHVEIWVPGETYAYLNHMQSAYAPGFYSFVARLAPNAQFEALERELNQLIPHLDPDPASARLKKTAARVYPGLGVEPLMRARTRTTVNVMLAIGAVLLILGCANVANLLVFRATRRQHELAVRKALGATRARLVRAALVESCVLSVAGAAIGLGLALVLKQLIQELLFPRPAGVPLTVPVDARVLFGTLALALLTGLIAAVAPAWLAVRRDVAPGTRQGTRGSTGVPKLRGGLAALQLALSLTLLIGALLLVTTLKNLRGLELGFNPSGLTALSVTLDQHGYKPPEALEYLRTTLGALEAHGEFDSVAVGFTAIQPNFNFRITHPEEGAPLVGIGANGVSHNYFETVETPFLLGRGFTAEEALSASGIPPVVVNRTLALRLFGRVDVLGRQVRIPGGRTTPARDLPIIGVIADTHPGDLTADPKPYLYQPLGRFMPARGGEFVIRSRLSSVRVGSAASAIVSRSDPAVPLGSIRPISTDIDRQLTQERLFAWVLSMLGALGFVLAAFGLYGLVSQTANERSREFGIRLAVGASRADIMRLIGRYAFYVSLAGVAAGLGLAYYGTRMVQSMLFGVTRLDPVVYLAAVGTLVLVVALACIAPALRAMRVEPVEVLRAE
jgi:putative ABC transport system permease protein